VCVKQKPAVGQPLNLQTLPLCLLLLLVVVVVVAVVVLISRVEARLRRATTDPTTTGEALGAKPNWSLNVSTCAYPNGEMQDMTHEAEHREKQKHMFLTTQAKEKYEDKPPPRLNYRQETANPTSLHR
jgi:hypothetical protein